MNAIARLTLILVLVILAAPLLAMSEGQYEPTIGRYKPTAEETIRYSQILFFTATWCKPCQEAKVDSFEWLKSAGWRVGYKATDDVRIVDIDANPHWAEEFAITQIPTLVMLKRGTEIARSPYVGRKTYSELLDKLKD